MYTVYSLFPLVQTGRPYSALLGQAQSAVPKKPAGGKRAGSSANKLSEPSGMIHPDGTGMYLDCYAFNHY